MLFKINNKEIAIPPGETIKEQLEKLNISVDVFAIKMGLTKNQIESLLNGQIKLTPNIAAKLESTFGIPAKFWSNLEKIYRNKLMRISS